jgi:hypothetical protein
MKWNWSHFTLLDQQKLESMFIEDFSRSRSNLFDVSSLLGEIQKIKYPIKDAARSTKIIDLVFDTISNYSISSSNHRPFSFLVFYFGKLGFEWNKLPQKLQDWFFNGINECYSSGFSTGSVSIIIYG